MVASDGDDEIEWEGDDAPTAVVVPTMTAQRRAAMREHRERRLARLAERHRPNKEE